MISLGFGIILRYGLTIVLYSGIISNFSLYTIFHIINPIIWFPDAATPFRSDIFRSALPDQQHMNIDKLFLVNCQDTLQAAPAVCSMHKRLETEYSVVEMLTNVSK